MSLRYFADHLPGGRQQFRSMEHAIERIRELRRNWPQFRGQTFVIRIADSGRGIVADAQVLPEHWEPLENAGLTT